jgi:ABC-type nickel/cobalt efflux system permease component RcnA
MTTEAIIGISVAIILLYVFWKTWSTLRRSVAWIFRRQHRSIHKARDERNRIRSRDRERVGEFLVSQYEIVADGREGLQDAIEDRDELVATGANAAQIAAADALIATRQQALDQAEEVLRIRERRARRLHPNDFRWLQR